MNQPMPTVRTLYLPALLPQFVAIAAIAAIFYFLFPAGTWVAAAIGGALIYKLICMTTRGLFARHHSQGIKAYKERRFDDAVAHFQNSYDFFDRHPLLDRFRWWIFATAGPNSYKTIAVLNMGYGEAMRGRHEAAAALFRRTLTLAPNCTNAEFGLRMISSERLPPSESTPPDVGAGKKPRDDETGRQSECAS